MRTRTVLVVLAVICIVAGLGWTEARGGEIIAVPGASLDSAIRLTAQAAKTAPAVISAVRTNQKVVAITFDDGPDPRFTPTILKLARAKDVKFTFFVIGQHAQRYPDLVRQEAADGHAVGNHTWDHHTMLHLTLRQNLSEITRCQDLVDRVCGEPPHLLRPPKGLWSALTYHAAARTGLQIVLWSLELEHHPGHSPQQMAARAISLVRPGTIILAHDGQTDHPSNRNKTVEALPLLVDGLKQKGYRFVTVPELLAMNGQKRRQAAVMPQTPGA